jgi:hypothetical protein
MTIIKMIKLWLKEDVYVYVHVHVYVTLLYVGVAKEYAA